MPAVSPEQQRLMGMAYALKKGEMDPADASDKVKQLADSMTLKQLKDFASTKHSDMKEHAITSFEKFLNEDYARVHPNPGMNVGGMGPIVIPEVGPYGTTGSGDVPAPYSSRDKKLFKKGKKKGVMPIKFAETDFKAFENLTQYEDGRKIMQELSESLNFMQQYHVFENNNSYIRLLETMMPVNEESVQYYSLSESRKNEIDDFIWETIYEYALAEDINEGFFSSIVSAVKDAGKSAIEFAKKVIQNIGAFLKAAKDYIKAGLIASIKAGVDASKTLIGNAKGQAEKLKNKVDTTKDLKKDIKDLKDTVNHIIKGLGSHFNNAHEAAAATILKSAPKEDIASAEKSLNKAEANEELDNLLHVGIKHAILEIKNNSQLLFSITEDAESIGTEIASDAEAKGEETVKKKEEKAKGKGISFKGVVDLIMTGIIKFVEAILEALFKYGFKAVSVVVATLGGPGAFEFAAISAVLAAVTGLILELFAEVIGELTGSKYLKMVSSALHATNPALLIGHAVEHALPGAGSIIKACCVTYAIYATVEHILHIAEHGEDSDKHKEEPAQA